MENVNGLSGISPKEDDAGSRRRRPSLRLFIACGLMSVVYLWSVAKFCSPIADGPDSSGYLNLARTLKRGKSFVRVPRIEGLEPPAWDYFRQTPPGFDVNPGTGMLLPIYPVGFPIHLTLAAADFTAPFAGFAELLGRISNGTYLSSDAATSAAYVALLPAPGSRSAGSFFCSIYS